MFKTNAMIGSCANISNSCLDSVEVEAAGDVEGVAVVVVVDVDEIDSSSVSATALRGRQPSKAPLGFWVKPLRVEGRVEVVQERSQRVSKVTGSIPTTILFRHYPR